MTSAKILYTEAAPPQIALPPAEAHSQKHYNIAVPSGTSSFTVTTGGGQGNADIYLQRSSPPTPQSSTWFTGKIGNEDSISLTAPTGGIYYILIDAYSWPYSGVWLEACYLESNTYLGFWKGGYSAQGNNIEHMSSTQELCAKKCAEDITCECASYSRKSTYCWLKSLCNLISQESSEDWFTFYPTRN